jgi:hypothetical protein
MQVRSRIKAATQAAITHLLLSMLVAAAAAGVVFGFWFPGPFRDMAGGAELFMLVVSVDVVCGPLLTLVLFNPVKRKSELAMDLGLILIVQIAALLYGMWTVWLVRPLFLPFEKDRFKVVALHDLRGADVHNLPLSLRPRLFGGPVIVGLRAPKDSAESQEVLLSSVMGGADYAERPSFYIPIENNRDAILATSRPLSIFINYYPSQRVPAMELAVGHELSLDTLRFLPVRARKDWVAVLSKQGVIIGYLPGDGFK